jgi:hypothetical protein
MSDIATIGADKTLDLASLNVWIAQQEQLLGPLTAIGDGGDDTAASFDMAQPPVSHDFTQLSLRLGADCVVPPGHVLVCQGEAYVGGALMQFCALRAAR